VNKPVGTVVFAVALKGQNPENVVGDKKAFGEDKSRADIRAFATLYALELLMPPAP